LSDGSNLLSDGSQTLSDASNVLSDGSQTLSNDSRVLSGGSIVPSNDIQISSTEYFTFIIFEHLEKKHEKYDVYVSALS
jgi:X-X-X-Leu-X-X-Gly heptad repeat protein